MKILYYDCFSGISGDMNLGALIDIGVDENYLISELSKLNIKGYEISVNKDSRKGVFGTKVKVILSEDGHEHIHTHQSGNLHNHCHNHEHKHEHESNHTHSDEFHHSHEHRNLNDIEKIINESSLNDNVKQISAGIFRRVAEAEAKIHSKPLEEVHFHEVGAVDSIIDIVGAAICLDYLKVDKIMSSTIEVGSGFVKCAHGLLPVPAPATVEILKGIPIKSCNIPFEATTPTGAAILTYTVNEFTDRKEFKIMKSAYGIGHKDKGDIPNVLRVFLAEK
jgi:uncharacterized protein (TIGR00299 family) protein